MFFTYDPSLLCPTFCLQFAEQQLQAATQRLQSVDQQVCPPKHGHALNVCVTPSRRAFQLWHVAAITGSLETAQSGRAALESALNGAHNELRELHARHTRMEQEYLGA
eukprot:1159813-Pelagomonas_calceolata.AAC.10